MKYIQNTKKQNGFTLIETLVAIFVLLISITAPLSSAQSGLRSSFLARDQVVAFYLAQDVIESVKHLRDNYALDGGSGDWLTGLGGCNPGSIGQARLCQVDTSRNNSVSLNSCANRNNCGQLYYEASSRKYTHTASGNSVSKYTRRAYITEVVLDREAQVIVEVEWSSNFFGIRRIVVQENIYNWVPLYID